MINTVGYVWGVYIDDEAVVQLSLHRGPSGQEERKRERRDEGGLGVTVVGPAAPR